MSAHNKQVIKYYSSKESRWGYRAVLGGTRHFGYYERDSLIPNLQRGLRRMEQELGEALTMRAGSSVLDAGCGEGKVAEYLCENFGLRIHGIDLVNESIRRANLLTVGLEGSLHFEVADYSHLPFPADTFDAVYTMETLVHSEDASATLREFFRVLKPGGRLACFEYSIADPSDLTVKEQALFEVINRKSGMASFGKFVHGCFPRLLSDAQFESIDTRDASVNIRPMLRFFCMIGIAPYLVLGIFGRGDRFINILSGVELFRMRKKWRYNIVTAAKPQ